MHPSPDDATSSVEQSVAREREFHDELAAELDPDAMPPRESGDLDAEYEDSILSALGSIDNKHILDLGCGTGDLSLRLMRRGAIVTGLDLSPGMVRIAKERAARFLPDATATFKAAQAEATGLEDESFDWIVGKWVLHHTDLDVAATEVRRLLKPGGGAVFLETSAMNPLLSFARRRLAGRWGISRFGTPDEHPIGKPDIEVLRRHFSQCRIDFPNFVFFYMLDRHILKRRWWSTTRFFTAFDKLIQRRLPRVGRASYYLRIRLDK